jgi:pimeloyl-ACP methyl ester carboxylesterase
MADTPQSGFKPDAALKRRNQRRRTPFVLKLIRFGFRRLGPLFPGPMARYAYRKWTATRRHPVPARELAWAEGAETSRIASEHGEIAVYRWGEGPTVLLIHGWDGRGTQLGGFAAPLVEAGYQVVAFDSPGHGKSPGDSSSIFKFTDAAQAVVAAHGPLSGVIAHSFGAAVTAYALNTGRFQAPRVVGISAPASIRYLLDRYCHILHIPPRVRRRMEALLEAEYHPGIWDEISPEVNARGILDTQALFLHDDKDRDVPMEQAERLHAAWSGARLERTSGLGHNRILRNPEIIDRAVAFIRSGG